MAEEKKKSEIRVESEGIVVAQHSSMKRKKKKKNREGFAGDDGEIAATEIEKLEVKDDGKKNKEIEADDDPGKSKRKRKGVDSVPESGVKKSNDGKKRKKKSKKESVGDEIGSFEEIQRDVELLDDAQGETRKREPDDSDFGADTDTSNDEVKIKRKKKKRNVDSQVEANIDSMKKKKQSEDSEAQENNNDRTQDAKKKQNVDSEDEANIDSMENSKKKQIEDSEAAVDHNVRTEDANKKQTETENSTAGENKSDYTQDPKKRRKKKQAEAKNSEARENNNDSKENAKKKRKKKQTETENSENNDSTEDAKKKKRKKQVKFSDQVEVFPSGDEESEEAEKVELVKGKRFTEEEDELIKKAVQEYIENHALGDDGLNMVLNCGSHPEAKGCWKEIESALPWRAPNSVYNRAHTIFEAGSKGQWSKEDFELLIEYQKKHGNDWRTLADAMGKHRKHVKDAWRRIRLMNKNKGHWSREEYQNLFDLVNTDLRLKAYQEKRSKHGMLRDNIPWMAISDELGTRDHALCCMKWYDQLTSPMVTKGIWANVDDYRLLDELTKLDAACVDDVDWDNLLDNRDGEACRKRWNQMVRHIGIPGTKTFAEQVEILSERYSPDIAEDRENFDNRPFDDIEVKEDL